MQKKRMFLSAIIATIVCSAVFLWGQKGVTLDQIKYGEKRVDDFILHARVEQVDAGVKVYSSIQYVGDDVVIVESDIPIIFASFNQEKDDFTDQREYASLTKGSIYLPEEMVVFSTPPRGKHELHVQANFYVDDEEISIRVEEELEFK